ncbi:MAG: undecaprenyl-diphosphate phosphatase [Candidatus Eisenbacteria bacterium]|nr:undecaprenyl-diphosphate phosphatase [Candidatus Eisenbacteria bacterium]
MTLLQGILLGVLQGLTEFLPVSSSGHLALAEYYLGINEPGVTFEVFVHFGTALAVVSFFRRRIASILIAIGRWATRRRFDADELRLAVHLILATIPAAAAGYYLGPRVESAFNNPMLVSILLLVTGCILWFSGKLFPGTKVRETWVDALVVGVAQAFAVLPGISRSGTTITAGLAVGLERRAAAEFAFLLSVPVIFGAAAASLGDALDVGGNGPAIALGTLAAFLSALPAIAILLRAVTAGKLAGFAYYCWALGAISLSALVMGS